MTISIVDLVRPRMRRSLVAPARFRFTEAVFIMIGHRGQWEHRFRATAQAFVTLSALRHRISYVAVGALKTNDRSCAIALLPNGEFAKQAHGLIWRQARGEVAVMAELWFQNTFHQRFILESADLMVEGGGWDP